MARYNREFLVPYLGNICALHMAESRLWTWYYQVMNKELDLENEIVLGGPHLPDYEKSVGCGSYILIITAIFLLAVSLTAAFSDGEWIPALVFLLLSCLCVFFVIRHVRAVNAKNKRLKEAYDSALNTFEIRCWGKQEKIDKMKKQMEEYSKEIKRIQALLEKMYSVNVIPMMYRESYPAVYLYDWFSTSGADDLDHALSMYVLEEIKSRLDTIIANQSRSILNQHVMMANQMRSIEQQRQYQNMMSSKLDRIQATNEQRLSYMRMIECNTSAMAFFATASYLRDK